jgi:hypothetical protein
VLGVRRVQQRPAVVDHDQAGLLRRVHGDDPVSDQPEQAGLAAFDVAEDKEVGVGGEVKGNRGERALVYAERDSRARLGGPGQLRRREHVGQHPHFGGTRARPGDVGALDEFPHGIGQAGDRRLTVDPRQRGQEVQAGPGQPAPGGALGDIRRDGAANLGLVRVTEAQLKFGTEQIPDTRPELRPFVGRRDHVDAVAEAARRQRRDRALQRLVVLPQGQPAVYHEEHIAIAIASDLPAGPHRPVSGDRLDAVGGELVLAPVQQGLHLRDRAADPVLLLPGRHAPHVRQAGQRPHRAPAEIQAVELHLGRRVQERERADERPQHVGLTALRSAGHSHVARRAGQVGPQRLTALVEGPVHDAGDGMQPAAPFPSWRRVAILRGSRQRRQQPVQGRRDAQRRQPDLARGLAVPGELANDPVEQAFLLVRRIVAARGQCRGRGVRQHLRPDVLRAVRHGTTTGLKRRRADGAVVSGSAGPDT